MSQEYRTPFYLFREEDQMTDPDYLVYLACWMCYHDDLCYRHVATGEKFSWSKERATEFDRALYHNRFANYYRELINDYAN